MKTYPVQDFTSNGIINPAWPENARPVSWIEKIVVHHDAVMEGINYPDQARYEEEAQYQNGHSIPGSRGIQYTYHIDNIGTITLLRPHDIFLWHCGDYTVNQHSIAICVDGNFSSGNQIPTREQYEALKQLLDTLSTQHPEFPASQKDVYPHREFYNTNCCGDNLVSFVDAYRNSGGSPVIPDVAYQHPELQPDPPLPTPVTTGTSMPEPVPVTTATTPVSILDNLPEYEATYVPEPSKREVIFPDTFATDATGAGAPLSIPEKVLVNIVGYFRSNDRPYYRLANSISHPEIDGAWYGIPFDAFGTDTAGYQPVTPNLPQAQTAMAALLSLLASIFSPLLRLVGKVVKSKQEK